MKKRQKGNKGIMAFKDNEAIQRELGLELERRYRKRTSDSLKESEEREAQEKAGQGNLFTTKRGGDLDQVNKRTRQRSYEDH